MLTARRHFAECVKEARNHGLVGVLLSNLSMLGLTEIYCGDTAVGRASVREGLEIARRVGDLRSELIALLSLTSGLNIQGQFDELRTYAEQALRLSKQLGARRFHAECLAIIANSMLSSEDRAAGLQLAEEGLQMSREIGMSYCGPAILGVLARLTNDRAQRAEALAEGETLLAGGCVSHSYFEFYYHAIEVSIEQNAWSAARRYANDLASYTEDEPLPSTDLQIDRARLLADVGENVITPRTRAALQALRERCREMNAVAAIPAIDAALEFLERAPTA